MLHVHRVAMLMPCMLFVPLRMVLALMGLHPMEGHVADVLVAAMVWPPIRVMLRVLAVELRDRMAQMNRARAFGPSAPTNSGRPSGLRGAPALLNTHVRVGFRARATRAGLRVNSSLLVNVLLRPIHPAFSVSCHFARSYFCRGVLPPWCHFFIVLALIASLRISGFFERAACANFLAGIFSPSGTPISRWSLPFCPPGLKFARS